MFVCSNDDLAIQWARSKGMRTRPEDIYTNNYYYSHCTEPSVKLDRMTRLKNDPTFKEYFGSYSKIDAFDMTDVEAFLLLEHPCRIKYFRACVEEMTVNSIKEKEIFDEDVKNILSI